MGGNVGDALAPLAVGALLTVLTWRQAVMINVAPGIVLALLIFLFLGTMQLGPKQPGSRAGTQSLREYFRGLPELFRNRGLIVLVTSSAFSSMTQNALLTSYRCPPRPATANGVAPAAQRAFACGGGSGSPVAGHLSGRGHRAITSMAEPRGARFGARGKSVAFVFFVTILVFLYAPAGAAGLAPQRRRRTWAG
jgi:hypothetical protein